MFYIYMDGKLIYQPLDDDLNLITPKLKVEMGKAGSLEFSIPPSNKYYNMIQQLRTGFVVEMDDEEIFRGRALSVERNFNNVRNVYGEGDLAYLIDSVQKAEKYHGSAHTLFWNIIDGHNSMVEAAKRFTVGSITVEDRDVILAGQSDEIEDAETGAFDYRQIAINSVADEWKTTYDYLESCLLSYVGGYLRTRYENGVTYIDWLKDYNSTATQEIEVGKNLLDLTEEISADDIFTVLIPLGDENLTIESVNNGSIELVNSEAVARFGRIVKTHVFSGVNQASTLLENGRRYLANHINAPVTVTVTAVDLHLLNPDIQPIRLGDKVKVVSPIHDMVDYLTCTRIEYDLSNPANNVYTFGEPKQSLTERYRRDKNKQEDHSGGGGGAGEAAQEKIDDGLEDFFNAWINVDPDSAHIDLGTLYKDYEKQKLVLQRDCGIDIDGVTGNINIKSLATRFDEAGQKISDNAARISLLQDDLTSKIELATAHIAKVDGREEGHYATLSLWANEKESVIAAKADKVTVDALEVSLKATNKKITNTNDVLSKQVGIDLSGEHGNVNITTLSQTVTQQGNVLSEHSTSINSISNDFSARIDLVTRSTSENRTKISALQLRTTNLESSITLKADKLTVDANIIDLKGRIGTLEAEYAEIDTVIAKKIQATWSDNLVITTGTLFAKANVYVDGHAVAINQHSHKLTESDGYVTIGYATSDPQSFKIADTNAYKEGVSAAVKAVTIETLEKYSKVVETYDATDHSINVYIHAETSAGKSRIARISVSGTKAYEDGYESGSEAGSESGFDDGVASVTIDSVARNPNKDDEYNESTHNKTVHLLAKASNGKTRESSIIVYGSQAYNAGRASIDTDSYVTQGKNSVTVDSISNGGRVGQPWQDDYGNRYITLRITAKASNEKTKTQDISTGVTDIYTSGVTAGRVGYTKGTFSAVDVYVLGDSMTRYKAGTEVSGTNQGNKCNLNLYFLSNGKYYKVSSALYYAGQAYSITPIGSSETVYSSGGKKTYYTKS